MAEAAESGFKLSAPLVQRGCKLVPKKPYYGSSLILIAVEAFWQGALRARAWNVH